jgi:hypothetical protein
VTEEPAYETTMRPPTLGFTADRVCLSSEVRIERVDAVTGPRIAGVSGGRATRVLPSRLLFSETSHCPAVS